MEKIQFKDFSSPSAIKDVDGKKGIVTGYFADFDSIDSDGDIILNGAFKDTILGMGPQAPHPRTKHLLNHDPEQPLGKLLVLKEDTKGLYYESQIGNHTLGKDFLAMAESGLIAEHSIGFRTLKYKQLQPWEDMKEGEAWRELTELKLYEGSSLTAWGANENTPLTGIKSEHLEQLVIKAKKIDEFCRNSRATDETIESLLAYNKELLTSIKNLQTSSGSRNPAEDGSHPENEVETEKSEPVTVRCPHCKEVNYNSEKAIKCRNCSKTFIPGLEHAFIF